MVSAARGRLCSGRAWDRIFHLVRCKNHERQNRFVPAGKAGFRSNSSAMVFHCTSNVLLLFRPSTLTREEKRFLQILQKKKFSHSVFLEFRARYSALTRDSHGRGFVFIFEHPLNFSVPFLAGYVQGRRLCDEDRCVNMCLCERYKILIGQTDKIAFLRKGRGTYELS